MIERQTQSRLNFNIDNKHSFACRRALLYVYRQNEQRGMEGRCTLNVFV